MVQGKKKPSNNVLIGFRVQGSGFRTFKTKFLLLFLLFPKNDRVPQLISNAKNQSVEGVSIAMFVITVLGNLCYGFSVIIRFPQLNQAFWAGTFPFILGSMGTLVFDFFLLYQAYKYRNNYSAKLEALNR